MRPFYQEVAIIKNPLHAVPKKFIALALIVVFAAGGAWWYQERQKAASVPSVNTISVSRETIQSAVSATGTISAVNSVDISSRVTGLIRELRVKENDWVSAGQVLVVLDDSSLQAQVAQYRAQLANYESIYARSRQLASGGGESEQQLDADRTNYLVAKANYDNYASQLGYYVITSPITGLVVGKPTPAGQTVAQGISTPQVIMTIADMSKMQIKVMVDETDIGKVQNGQQVSFTVDAYPNRTFTGVVSNISRSATTSSNVIYYPVYVDVDSAEGLLFPTMTARVTILISQREQVLAVPSGAIKEENGRKTVQVLQDGKTVTLAVETGLSNDEKIEIISGLEEGMQVVLPTAKAKTASGNQGPPPRI